MCDPMVKPKQQQSLLSFFSPPANGAAPKPKSASATSDKSSGSSSKPKPTGSGSGKKVASSGGSRKRIDFSPKLKQDAPPTKAVKNKAKAAVEDGDVAEGANKLSAPASGSKRKAYEDFLGTSSEDDKAKPTAGDKKKQPESSSKRLRRSTVKMIVNDDSDSDEPITPARKATKNVVSSEEEWDGGNESREADDDNDSEFSAGEKSSSEEDEDDGEEEEENEEPVRPSKRRKAVVTPTKTIPAKKTPTKQSTSGASFVSPKSRSPAAGPKASPSASSAPNEGGTAGTSVSGAGSHAHNFFPWLNEKRRDINGNKPDSPDYDPRTLLVPQEFLKKDTPAMVQWWNVKAQNMDTVLFFKVGKFYELFHMDADIGFKELNLIYMKGDKAHSGFPEIAYSKMSSQLIEKGYRVARVEQTETPEMLKERNAGSSKKAKVVRREVCSLLSTGTNTISFLDAPISSREQTAKHLLALKEEVISPKQVRFGICMIDCATGAVYLSEFDDTEQRDRLKTLLAQYCVVEIVSERFGLSDDTKMVLNHAVPSSVRVELRVGKEFWDPSRTIEEISRAGYFDEQGWPTDVLFFLTDDKTVKIDGQLAISALGGCIWHLRRSIIDQELLSLCNFSRYRPSDEEAKERREHGRSALLNAELELKQQYVVLDSQTIHNLEILTNNFNGGRAGSLIDILDKTVTSFGKRMFQDWVLKPLCKISDINERLDAVQELGQNGDTIVEVREHLRKLPDLERLLSRIHAIGSVHRAKEHPDSRAIMYESNTYNIRKIRDFLAVLKGFDVAMSLVSEMSPRFARFQSPVLQTVIKVHDETSKSLKSGHFPDLREKLNFFEKSFDQAVAQKSGTIVPKEGADPEYDECCEEIQQIETELQEYLEEQKSQLKCKQIVYWGTKKDDRFQLEIPESAVQSKQPKEYELKSRKKGYKRFHTPTIRDLLARLTRAEDRKTEALKDQMRRIFHKFDEDYRYWMKAVQCLAVLDCLLSLALVSSQSEGYVKPEVVSAVSANAGVPFLDIEEGVHPCVATTFGNGDFIPNSVGLGIDGAGEMMLLSGPNMGGKSTLLRQTCVIALMAQIGCFVPASKCRMTPVDRIFTRIGASDRILAGQSTLYVELSETATILNHATGHSLVILDELGRGTSTFDGTAIAYSVVEHLLREVQCRTMLATHYHSLVEEYAENERVSLGHMGCLVDPENERKVTFLYKLEEGMCPKSYGLNVAMLAKLPAEVIELAASKSEQFEKSLQATSHSDIEAQKILDQVKDAIAEKDHVSLRKLWEQAHNLVFA